jgi:hypothetical protein
MSAGAVKGPPESNGGLAGEHSSAWIRSGTLPQMWICHVLIYRGGSLAHGGSAAGHAQSICLETEPGTAPGSLTAQPGWVAPLWLDPMLVESQRLQSRLLVTPEMYPLGLGL